MKVSEFLANPPDLSELLERVKAGDAEAVELVEALFAKQENDAALAKWVYQNRQQLDRFGTAMKLRATKHEQTSSASAGRSAKSQAIKRVLFNKATEKWPRFSNNQIAHTICYRHPTMWTEIVTEAGYPEEKCWSVSTIERALGQQRKLQSPK